MALNAESGAPEWIMLFPNGRMVVGRDKRQFLVNDPEAVAANSRPLLPLVIDYEHDFEMRSPGDDTPAAGWIEELEVRDGAIWGRASWSARAANAIAGKEWRFISPVLLYRRDTDPMEVAAIASAGLTHRPNLDLKALNRASSVPKEDPVKDLLIKLFGLKADASDADIIAAANALKTDHDKALNSQNDLTRFVPKSQHDETVAALNAANTRLADRDKADAKRAAEALVDDAVKGGKVAPAARDSYLALALNNFDGTRAALDLMPAVLAGGQADIKADPATAGGGTLTADEKALCSTLGITEEDFRKAAA
jgi:phage I-like protein